MMFPESLRGRIAAIVPGADGRNPLTGKAIRHAKRPVLGHRRPNSAQSAVLSFSAQPAGGRMRRTAWLAVGVVAVGVLGFRFPLHAAPEPAATFTKDIAPILHKKCVSCHRPGEVAPMSLLTYEDARPWVRSIKAKVAARQMPPWFADPTYGSFANDPRLSDAEISTIGRWVDAGAPLGDPKAMPKPPQFTEGWQLGE